MPSTSSRPSANRNRTPAASSTSNGGTVAGIGPYGCHTCRVSSSSNLRITGSGAIPGTLRRDDYRGTMPTTPRYRPLTVERPVTELADRIAETAAHRRGTRVLVGGVGGAPATAGLAHAPVHPSRVRGHEVMRVSAGDFLRPASLRFERGRHDPDVRYEDWLDGSALRREVLGPLESTGTEEVLPALWD